jgi:hypothetical protein
MTDADIFRRQKPTSTDPDYLERMACAAERPDPGFYFWLGRDAEGLGDRPWYRVVMTPWLPEPGCVRGPSVRLVAQ